MARRKNPKGRPFNSNATDPTNSIKVLPLGNTKVIKLSEDNDPNVVKLREVLSNLEITKNKKYIKFK